MARRVHLGLMLVFSGCAGACSTLVPPNAPALSPVDPPAVIPVEAEPPDFALSPELLASLELAPTQAEGSDLALLDPNSGRWVVVDMNYPLGEEPYATWIGVVSAEDEQELVSGHVEAAQIPQHVSAFEAYTRVPNAVAEVSSMVWSTGGRVPLVRVGAAILYVTRGDDTWEVRLYDPYGSFSQTLVIRPAAPASMPATLTLQAVRIASVGGTMLLQGWIGPEFDERAGAFHWVVPLPDEVSQILQEDLGLFEFTIGDAF